MEKCRVLVVDAEPQTAKYVSAILRQPERLPAVLLDVIRRLMRSA